MPGKSRFTTTLEGSLPRVHQRCAATAYGRTTTGSLNDNSRSRKCDTRQWTTRGFLFRFQFGLHRTLLHDAVYRGLDSTSKIWPTISFFLFFRPPTILATTTTKTTVQFGTSLSNRVTCWACVFFNLRALHWTDRQISFCTFCTFCPAIPILLCSSFTFRILVVTFLSSSSSSFGDDWLVGWW